VLNSILLILAALGWLTSVLGAVLLHLGAAKVAEQRAEGTFTISTTESRSRWGLTMVILGASAGAVGTILAVLASE